MNRRVIIGEVLAFFLSLGATMASGLIELKRDEPAGVLEVRIDGQPAFAYRYGSDVDLPHYYPVWSPSGRLLTVQQTEPYPHHRSFWFVDKVELAGHGVVDFYSALYSRADRNDPASPFVNRIRHAEFLPPTFEGKREVIRSRLIWEADGGRTPVLDELRQVKIVPLGGGEYLLDMQFTLTAGYGDVTFRSDAVHYAWPFLRMHPQFSVESGGTITSSEGGVNQEGTHDRIARWIDYSNTIEGKAEGLSVFSHTENEHPHRWLTRDYGTFGPRRVDAKSGRPFVLQKGQSLRQRVGILVHKGDLQSGRVAGRYGQYLESGPGQ